MSILSGLNQVPVFNFSKSAEDARTIKIRCDFATDTVFTGNFSQERRMGIFQTLRSVYFNLRNCVNDVVFSCPETGQSIRLNAGKQGYRNVLISMGMNFKIEGTSPDVAEFNLLNVDMPESEWPNISGTANTIPLSGLVNAAAQYDIIGRKTAGAGAWEDCTRPQLLLAATDLANVFTVSPQELQSNGIAETFVTRYANVAGGPRISGRKARGTSTVPLIIASNDSVTNVRGYAYDGVTFVNVANFSFNVIEPIPSTTALGTRFEMSFAPVGSIAGGTDAFAIDHSNGLMLFGITSTNTVIRQNRGLVRRPLTFGTLPAAAANPDTFFTITDGAAAPIWNGAAAGGAAVRTPVWSNGVAWMNG